MVLRTEVQEDRRLEVLGSSAWPFGSASDFSDVATSASRWIRAAIGTDDASVRIVLPDGVGRLRVASTDRSTREGGRRRSARRRAAFVAGTPVRLDLDGPDGESLAILPLLCRGEPVGVLEVVARREIVEERWESLLSVSGQVALALWTLRHEAALRREVETLGEAVSLGRDLLRARSAEAAVGEAVAFLHERFQVPVAAWLPADDPEQMVMSEIQGLGTRRRRELRAAMGVVPRWQLLSNRQRLRLADRFAEIVGAEEAEPVGSARALLLIGESNAALRTSADFVGSLLESVLEHLAATALVERREEELDLGIAWTAHEFRGPLMGVKAVLEFLLREESASPANQAMLRRSLRELEHLSGLVDGLLRWALGVGGLQRRQTDLVRVVEEAVESIRMETGEDRIDVVAPDRVLVKIDPQHLRGAIANLIRNAIVYSPRDSSVEVSVTVEDEAVRVTVRDQGPSIPPADREAIFDPFIRGGPESARTGKGLGLFITRRVVEAHDGVIWLESNGRGTAFHIRLRASE